MKIKKIVRLKYFNANDEQSQHNNQRCFNFVQHSCKSRYDQTKNAVSLSIDIILIFQSFLHIFFFFYIQKSSKAKTRTVWRQNKRGKNSHTLTRYFQGFFKILCWNGWLHKLSKKQFQSTSQNMDIFFGINTFKLVLVSLKENRFQC